MSENTNIPNQGTATEVPLRPKRRNFSAQQKLDIITGANACAPGTVASYLRKQGLYSTQLTDWRQIYEEQGLAGLEPKKTRSKRKAIPEDQVDQLSKDVLYWRRRAERAEALVDLQKKISQLFGISLEESKEKSS